MKKTYIKPSITVYFADLEPLLAVSGGDGLQMDQNLHGGSCSLGDEFTDDSSDDTLWPESGSLWD